MTVRRAAVLAAAHGPAGLTQLLVPYDTLVRQPRLGALDALSPRTTRLLGAAQLSAAVVLSRAGTHRLHFLAAGGLVLVQLGALAAHVRRRELSVAPVNLALAAVAASVAGGAWPPAVQPDVGFSWGTGQTGTGPSFSCGSP